MSDRKDKKTGMDKFYEEFLYAVTHDVKAPFRQLNVLLDMFVEDMKQDFPLTDAHLNLVRLMKETCKQGEGKLAALTDLSHAKTQLCIEGEFALKDVLVDAYKGAAGGVAMDIAGDMDGLYVKADKAWLRRAFAEVYKNAFLFHKPGASADVHTIVSRDEDGVCVAIYDKGIGVRSENRERAFGVLQQLNHADDYPGYGMGLTIARSVVEAHGGYIGFQDVGKGACVTVRLPLAQGE